MKLSEALAQRADLQKRLQQVLERAKSSALFQEGTKPAEDSNELLQEHGKLCEQLEQLIQRINRTNSATKLEDGGTISDAIATRDLLKYRSDAVRQLADAAIPSQARYGRSEILLLTKIDVAALRKRADQLMREHRAVDQAIQQANWSTELLA